MSLINSKSYVKDVSFPDGSIVFMRFPLALYVFVVVLPLGSVIVKGWPDRSYVAVVMLP